ncbi:MAG: ABC transporter ATP-binding protein [Candidatus Neomarinimicrobiota bacterium]|nr:ABC transporter ATP-binding protein [Candidatus Neomarinimicrobiota bacterium]MEC9475111.1 ABC transporter ATP-binding protein [Candidatus Neomarinimicrobiota bacterium]MED5433970.1 ABC transporter ATP-binding protein [Candidatus Neomarinimicrobiota bacterium]|tara:strand:- start:14798 stop:15715 length:918 start_codon:yes stop_codon:yes gene_type:complete
MHAINIKGLKKTYNGTKALKGINMEIAEGEFFGLLGPNGAGKTTTINILTGLVRKDEGETMIFNRDTVNDYRFTRKQVGIAAQEFTQDWFFPLDKLLLFQAGYYGINKKDATDLVESLLERLGLQDKRNARIRQLSGGMKRRFQIAKALVHDPKILILDEPTAGVDVELRHELWEYFSDLHKEGKTILLTTHYIEEAELLCDKVAIIDSGKVISKGSPKELIGKDSVSGITVFLSEVFDDSENVLNSFTYNKEDKRLHFTTQDPENDMPKIISLLSSAGAHIQRIETDKASLEDVFLNLTGKGIN